MATPAVTPAAPAAPSSPAPVAPAPSAPSSSPAATPTPPSAPAPAPATPSPEPASPDSPAAPEAPAAPPAPFDPKTSPVAPKNTDYGNTAEGQARFLTDLKNWEREQKDKPAAPAPPPSAEQTPEQKALAEANAPEKTPEGAAEAAAAEAAATPQELAGLIKDVPEFGEFLKTDAGKKVQGRIFQTARELAAIKPIAEIFPSVADAQFAQEYSTAMVGLKTASMRLMDNPESAGDFLTMFDSQFAQVDDKGQPVLKDGKPVYDGDREVVRGALFNSVLAEKKAPLAAQAADLEAKLKGNYPSDFARQQDQQKLDNLNYAKDALDILDQIIDGSFFDIAAPEPPADATPEVKAWYEQQKADLERQKEEIKAQKQGASKEERAAQKTQFASQVRSDTGTAVGTVIQNQLKAAMDSGVYIPAFYMQEKYVDPTTGRETDTSAMAVRIYQKFLDKIEAPGSRTLMDIVKHEMLPQNEQTRAMRKDWYAKQAADMVPGLVDAEIARIQSLVKLDQEKQEQLLGKRREVAAPEPSTGGSALPQGASREAILQAAEEAAKKIPGFAEASPSDKQAMIVTQFNKMSRK